MNVTGVKYKDRLEMLAAHAETAREFLLRRRQLLRAKAPAEALRPPAKLFAREFGAVLEPIRRKMRPALELPQSQIPRSVVLLPGFGTHPARMNYMARHLEGAGHTVKHWGWGFNLGPSEELFDHLSDRITQLHERFDDELVLVGWSLGGLYARELAKLHPEKVDKVISMGSPFSHSPYSNNVWRVYEMVTGHSVQEPPVGSILSEKPPVETVAFWSPRDGVIASKSARGLAGERDRAVAVDCTHMGFCNSDEAIVAVAKELERG